MMDTSNMIFVFGSNLAGIHGAGAARFAFINRGARWGNGVGIAGQSYAIPTKDRTIRHTLPLPVIKGYVDDFLMFSRLVPDTQFQVTCIGCGLAGLKHADMAKLFVNAPSNCYFDELWRPYLGDHHNYWGTF